MSEIEITTTGELKLFGDVIGHISWVRPYIESDVAGFWVKEEDAFSLAGEAGEQQDE